MRFVVMVQVNTAGGAVWHRRVIHSPVGLRLDALLKHPSARLTLDRREPDPEGGMRFVCQPLDGDHFVFRLREALFEPCAAPG